MSLKEFLFLSLHVIQNNKRQIILFQADLLLLLFFNFFYSLFLKHEQIDIYCAIVQSTSCLRF